jgi:small multidrug resistance pump
MSNWIYLGLAIIAEVIATSALKDAKNFTALYPSILVVVNYILAFYFLSLSLRTIPLAIAYATWSGLGIAIIAAIGWFYHHQHLNHIVLLGMLLIIVGVVLMKLNT